MPPPDLSVLDAAFRQQQATIAAATATAVARLWSATVDPKDLQRTGSAWVERSIPLIQAGRARSAGSAATYAGAVRRIVAPTAPPFTFPPAPAAPVDQLRTSLWVTGVVNAQARLDRTPGVSKPSALVDLRRRLAGEPATTVDPFRARQQALLDRGADEAINGAMQEAINKVSGATARHVLNGGRDSIRDGVRQDKVALGYVRVTRANPCAFCAMLASRIVYKDNLYSEHSFDRSDPRFDGEGTAKVHDNCYCTLRPIYTKRSDEIPELNRRFDEMWRERGDGDPLNAFRRYYERGVA